MKVMKEGKGVDKGRMVVMVGRKEGRKERCTMYTT